MSFWNRLQALIGRSYDAPSPFDCVPFVPFKHPVTFSVSEKELETANAWKEKHIKDRHNGKYPYAGAIGGAFSWEFTPTGLGVCITVHCMCGDSENVTDWD